MADKNIIFVERHPSEKAIQGDDHLICFYIKNHKSGGDAVSAVIK